MKIASITLCLVASLTSSCAITYLQLNSTQLQPATEAYAAQNYELCRELLSDIDADDLVIGARHEYAFMRGMSAHHITQSGLAKERFGGPVIAGFMAVPRGVAYFLEVILELPSTIGLSDYDIPANLGLGEENTDRTQEAIWQLSNYLALPGAVPAKMRVAEKFLYAYANKGIQEDVRWYASFWGNGLSRVQGFSILEDLAILASDVELQAQAIARVAEYYFSNRRYKLAIPYYSMLLNQRFYSLGWEDRASYRFAECRYLMLIPDKSDERSIMFALKSAQSYLEDFPAGANRVDALAIADDCVTKIAQLHLTIAEYYVTISNQPGAEHHFKLASGQESQGDASKVGLITSSNPVAQIAVQRLAEYAE